MLFVLAEAVLVMAIPFLAVKGYHTLLESRAGIVVDQLSPADPGWTALVDPTPVYGVAEVLDGSVTGLTLVVGRETSTAGSVILAPASLSVVGGALDAGGAEQAVSDLARAMRLDTVDITVVDEAGWSDVLGDQVYVIDNPDPVPAADGTTVFPVGMVEVTADNAAVFLGRPLDGAPAYSTLVRRQRFWSAVVADPPGQPVEIDGAGGADGADSLAAHLVETFEPAGGQVLELPTVEVDGSDEFTIDPAAVEELVRTTVAFPAGSDDTDRLRLRIMDRSGDQPITEIAAALAGHGIEVVQIGRALRFDDGPTEVVVPGDIGFVNETADSPAVGAVHQLDDLSDSLGAVPVIDPEADPGSPATLLVGSDFSLDRVVVRAAAEG